MNKHRPHEFEWAALSALPLMCAGSEPWERCFFACLIAAIYVLRNRLIAPFQTVFLPIFSSLFLWLVSGILFEVASISYGVTGIRYSGVSMVCLYLLTLAKEQKNTVIRMPVYFIGIVAVSSIGFSLVPLVSSRQLALHLMVAAMMIAASRQFALWRGAR